jgi:hypothetical protein
MHVVVHIYIDIDVEVDIDIPLFRTLKKPYE